MEDRKMKLFRKTICVILMLAISAGICSCSFNPFGVKTDKYALALASEKREVSYEESMEAGYLGFLTKLSGFSSELSAALYKKLGAEQNMQDENICFSPVSVYMALALAVECSGGETREEILSALGMSYDEVRAHTATLYSMCNKTFNYTSALGAKKVSAFSELNNSVWLDDSVKVNMNSANSLASKFNADIFAADFESGEADRVIKQYIKDKTHGLIDGDLKMDPETVFALINTFYLKELWDYLSHPLDKTDKKYSFENSDGSTENTYLLKTEYISGKAYEGSNYQSCFARTSHGYNLHFILPSDGVPVSEVFTENNLSAILSLKDYGHIDDENRQLHYTRILFPEFEAEFDGNIEGILSEDFGIDRLFSPEEAEMSALSLESGFNLYCGKVVHKTALKVDEMGIEGASITAMPGAGAAGPPEYEEVYHDLTVDRAFGFIITDSQGVVLFSGVVNEID